MQEHTTRVLPVVVLTVLITAGLVGCSSPDTQLEHAQTKIRSLTATSRATADAWLNGDVSATYSRTTFEQMLRLLGEQRTALNSTPRLLADPRGAALSRDAEQLSRSLAGLIQDANRGDLASVRARLSQLPQAGSHP